MATADTGLNFRPLHHDISGLEPVRPHAGDSAAPARDDLDDLFNYDAQADEVFRDVDQIDQIRAVRGLSVDSNAPKEGLGIDEEVKVRKKRAPIAKLDEERLLGPTGISKLRKTAKENLKLKGKGHEFSDVAKILSMYQLWLDDMFPKANFADGLSIIEKIGHKRRLQIMRQEWINESKPRPWADDEATSDREPGSHDDSDIDEIDDNAPSVPDAAKSGGKDASRPAEGQKDQSDGMEPSEEELYREGTVMPSNSLLPNGENDGNGLPKEDEAMDDLDLLLLEGVAAGSSFKDSGRHENGSHEESDFEDEMEAMQGIW